MVDAVDVPKPKITEESAVRQAVDSGGASRVELSQQPLGRDLAVGVPDDLGDLVPVRIQIDPYPDPAAVSDIRWPEVLLWIFGDELLLGAGPGRAPEGQPVGAVVVIIHRHELLCRRRRTPRRD